jgi:hypothetical protein
MMWCDKHERARFCRGFFWTYSYGRVQGEVGPRQVGVPRLGAKLKCAAPGPPGIDWVSGCSGPPLAICSYCYRFGYEWFFFSGKKENICENNFFKRSLFFPERGKFWQQVPWSEVRILGFLEAPEFSFGKCEKECVQSQSIQSQMAARNNNTFQFHNQITLSQ